MGKDKAPKVAAPAVGAAKDSGAAPAAAPVKGGAKGEEKKKGKK